jgi:hypothetical protein
MVSVEWHHFASEEAIKGAAKSKKGQLFLFRYFCDHHHGSFPIFGVFF